MRSRDGGETSPRSLAQHSIVQPMVGDIDNVIRTWRDGGATHVDHERHRFTPFVDMRASYEHAGRSGRFDDVVATDAGHQAAADERHVSERIEHIQFTQGIGEHDIGSVVDLISVAASRIAPLGMAEQFRHLIEPLRMSRRDHPEQVG